MRDIAKNIRDLRNRKNMTQEELAEKLFVTRQTISNYETGKSRPDIDMLTKISEVLEADVNEVLYGPEKRLGRKQDILWFDINMGICITLWFMMYVLDDITWDLYLNSFHTFPRMLQYLILCPVAFFCTGYTLMQLLSLVTGLRPIKENYALWVRRGILVVLLGVLVVMLPFFYSMIEGSIRYLIFQAQNPSGGSFLYKSPFKSTQLHLFLVQLLTKQPWILGLFGGALWLVQKPKTK